MEIGTIFNYTSFANLQQFDVKGTWGVNAGALTSAGGDSVLQYKYASALDEFVFKIRVNSPDLKLQLYGIRVQNNIRSTFGLNAGRAQWQFAYDGTTGTSATAIVIDTNDVLEYVITKSKWNVAFTVNNVTKGTSTTVNAGTSIAVTINKLRMWSATPLRVTSFSKTSSQELSPLNLTVGDSITYGSSATTAANRWTTRAGFDTEGSPGDTSAEGLELLYEIINIIKPRRVIYAFGTNDLNIDTWKANLETFRLQMQANYITFIPITPYANNGRSMQPYRDYIVLSFTKYFDMYAATKAANSTNLRPEINVDGTHFNNLGHQNCADAAINSPWYTYTPIEPPVNTGGGLLAAVIKWFAY